MILGHANLRGGPEEPIARLKYTHHNDQFPQAVPTHLQFVPAIGFIQKGHNNVTSEFFLHDDARESSLFVLDKI